MMPASWKASACFDGASTATETIAVQKTTLRFQVGREGMAKNLSNELQSPSLSPHAAIQLSRRQLHPHAAGLPATSL